MKFNRSSFIKPPDSSPTSFSVRTEVPSGARVLRPSRRNMQAWRDYRLRGLDTHNLIVRLFGLISPDADWCIYSPSASKLLCLRTASRLLQPWGVFLDQQFSFVWKSHPGLQNNASLFIKHSREAHCWTVLRGRVLSSSRLTPHSAFKSNAQLVNGKEKNPSFGLRLSQVSRQELIGKGVR